MRVNTHVSNEVKLNTIKRLMVEKKSSCSTITIDSHEWEMDKVMGSLYNYKRV